MRFLSFAAFALLTLTPLGARAASPPPAPAATASAVPVAPPPASLTDLSLKIIAAVATGKLDRTLFSTTSTSKSPRA